MDDAISRCEQCGRLLAHHSLARQDQCTRSYGEWVAAEKTRALAFLKGAGILDQHGELADPYRSA